MKIYILLLTMLFIVPFTMAETGYERIDLIAQLEHTNESSSMTIEGTTIQWSDSENRNFSIFRILNETVCPTFQENITKMLTNYTLMMNNRSNCLEDLVESQELVGRQAERLEARNILLKETKNETRTAIDNEEACQTDYNAVLKSKRNLQTEYEGCQQQNQTLENDIPTSPIIWLIAGAGGMFFYNKRNENRGKTGHEVYDNQTFSGETDRYPTPQDGN